MSIFHARADVLEPQRLTKPQVNRFVSVLVPVMWARPSHRDLVPHGILPTFDEFAHRPGGDVLLGVPFAAAMSAKSSRSSARGELAFA